MSGRPQKLSAVKRDDEIWTEEEVIEFGLAGEEEFCEMPLNENDVSFASEEGDVVEDMAACEEASAISSTGMGLPDYRLKDMNTTKSGRIRKKSAKWMEMEESDRLEKILVDPSSKSRRQRTVPLDFTIDETLKQPSVAEFNPVPYAREEKPTVHARFGLGAFEQPNDFNRRERKRRKLSESEFIDPDSEFDSKLVIDEPRGVTMQNIDNRPIHIKLSMRPDMTASITHSSTSACVPDEEDMLLSRKSRKISKRLSDIEGVDSDYRPESNADGHMYHSRLHRKHKMKQGKIRKKRPKGYTAYMLWCSTMREKLVSQNPGIDFANVSKLLGDSWHTVPEKEKKIYRRKARKLSKLAKKGALGSLNATEKCTEVISADGRVARVGTGRPVGRPPVHGYKRNAAEELGPGCKVVGIGPLDVAAHLKLLGESLTTIGNRLQEHRGRIAVQGSLSVLLDSLLCTLGPLMCLTAQVPELNGCPDYVHASTLNNIAYIMPGIG